MVFLRRYLYQTKINNYNQTAKENPHYLLLRARVHYRVFRNSTEKQYQALSHCRNLPNVVPLFLLAEIWKKRGKNLRNSAKTPIFARKFRKRKEKHGKNPLSRNGHLPFWAPLQHTPKKAKTTREDAKIGARHPAIANFIAFLKKNVQNYLQDLGFMPIFAAKLQTLCKRYKGKMW